MKEYFRKMSKYGELIKAILLSTLAFVTLFFADSIDLPSKIITSYGVPCASVFALGIVITILFFVINNNIIGAMRTNIVNEVDSFLFLAMCFNIVYVVVLLGAQINRKYKLVFLTITLIILIALFIYRIWICIIKKDNTDNRTLQPNVYDIQEFLDKKDGFDSEHPILFAEQDVEYDLFKRIVLTDQLYNSIISCCGSKYSFVIGLEGKWGSGKTTIANNVISRIENEQKDEFIIVDCFDPWTYSSPESLLNALFDCILSKANIRFSKSSLVKLIDNIIISLMGVHAIGNVAGTFLKNNENTSLDNIKEQITEYLNKNNKTIIVFIDNLDRADSKNIVFLLKLINTVFDLERMVYVLSYDKERIDLILNENSDINKNYIDKIVQERIIVSPLKKASMRIVVERCFKKLLDIYEVDYDDNGYEYIIEYMTNLCEDLRVFKRLLNSISFVFKINNELYKPDLFTLEIIRFFSTDLYDSIQKNPEYYVFTDTDVDVVLSSYRFNRDAFNKDAKEYFDTLKKTFDLRLLEFLANMFPYVERSLNDEDVQPDYDPQFEDLKKDITLNCKAASAKFFDLYFYHNVEENDFIGISTMYNTVVNSLVDKDYNGALEDIITSFKDLFCNIPTYYHLEFVEKLWLVRDEIRTGNILPTIIGLISNINFIYPERGFFALSAQQRATAVIASLLVKLNKSEKEKLLQVYSKQVKYIKVFEEVIYWLDSLSKNDKSIENDKKLLEDLVSQMYESTIADEIDIFSSENYGYNNIWALLKIKRRINHAEEDAPEDLHEYIKKIFKPQYIYKLLAETIRSSFGSGGYAYSIAPDGIKCFFENEDLISESIKQFPPEREIEFIIESIYDSYLNDKPNDLGFKEFKFDRFIDFNKELNY